jgi:hypothetical protein
MKKAIIITLEVAVFLWIGIMFWFAALGCVKPSDSQTCIFEFEDGSDMSYANVRRVSVHWFSERTASVYTAGSAVPIIVTGYTRSVCLRPQVAQ